MKPLEGIRILDFTQFFSGPICTLLLSDYGAEVIKLENPPAGDSTRYGKVMVGEASTHYATRNRGKKSAVINMKDEEQKNFFLELVKTADAVVENFKPGTMEKFGITYELLKELNPKIVYTRISGYGQEGPYASHAAYDATVQAESGVMSITGEAGGRPVKCGGSIADYCGGLMACVGTLMGILDAQKRGNGRCIDISMMDSLLLLQENMLSSYIQTGMVPKPNGNRYPAASPIGDFMCKDGIPVMLNIATDAQFKAFAEVLGQPQWLEEPDFATMSLRAENYEKMESEVLRVFSDMTSAEVAEKLQSRKLVYGNINNYKEVVNHPQVKFRNTFVHAVYPDGTDFLVPGNPILMSGMEREMEYETVPLGYHTMEVFSEIADSEQVRQIMEPVMEQVHQKKQDMFYKK